jgi:hypothetical protein
MYYTLHKHRSRKGKNNAEWGERVVLDNAIVCKFIDLRSSAVQRFSDSDQLPEDGHVRPKYVEIDAILMLF